MSESQAMNGHGMTRVLHEVPIHSEKLLKTLGHGNMILGT